MAMQRVRSRPNRRSRLLALSVLTVILPTLAASGLWNTPVQGQVRSETLIIVRNIDDYVTNDPGRQYEYTSQMLDQSSYDTLVTLEAPDFTKIQPKLADRWEISKDGLTYTFHLHGAPGSVRATRGPQTTSASRSCGSSTSKTTRPSSWIPSRTSKP